MFFLFSKNFFIDASVMRVFLGILISCHATSGARVAELDGVDWVVNNANGQTV